MFQTHTSIYQISEIAHWKKATYKYTQIQIYTRFVCVCVCVRKDWFNVHYQLCADIGKRDDHPKSRKNVKHTHTHIYRERKIWDDEWWWWHKTDSWVEWTKGEWWLIRVWLTHWMKEALELCVYVCMLPKLVVEIISRPFIHSFIHTNMNVVVLVQIPKWVSLKWLIIHYHPMKGGKNI